MQTQGKKSLWGCKVFTVNQLPREFVESLFMRIFKSNWIWPWVACIRWPCLSSDELYHKISKHFFQSKEFWDSVIQVKVRKTAGKWIHGCSLGRLDNCCRRLPTDILQSGKEMIKQKYQSQEREVIASMFLRNLAVPAAWEFPKIGANKHCFSQIKKYALEL